MSTAKVQCFLRESVDLIACQMQLQKSLMYAHTAASVQACKRKVYAAQFHFCL